MIKYTAEQKHIISTLASTDGIILVDAGAGSGKTFLAKQVVFELDARKVLYTAFNKAIVEDSKDSFHDMNVDCRTLHSLAYQFTQPSTKVESLTYRDFPTVDYKDRYPLLQSIQAFCLSASTDPEAFLFENLKQFVSSEHLRIRLTQEGLSVLNEMANRERSWTFDFMLKYLHLLLLDGAINPEYNLVILDEINDTTAVALEIFRLIKAPKKLGLGEPDQAIYGFMNLVNGFEILTEATVLPLTQSFRCSKPIAAGIEQFMRKHVNEQFSFKGTDTPVANGKTLYCTRTNAAVIKRGITRFEEGKTFKLLRKPSDIFACVLALVSAQNNKQIYQSAYKFLGDMKRKWEDENIPTNFFTYLVETLNDPEIAAGINLLRWMKKTQLNVFEVYQQFKDMDVDKDYVIATVFTSKGLEFETVHIDISLNVAVEEVLERDPKTWTEEDITELKCYYVATSRAGKHLHNATHLELPA